MSIKTFSDFILILLKTRLNRSIKSKTWQKSYENMLIYILTTLTQTKLCPTLYKWTYAIRQSSHHFRFGIQWDWHFGFKWVKFIFFSRCDLSGKKIAWNSVICWYNSSSTHRKPIAFNWWMLKIDWETLKFRFYYAWLPQISSNKCASGVVAVWLAFSNVCSSFLNCDVVSDKYFIMIHTHIYIHV